MKVDAPMDSYAARLASFSTTHTTQKKRASDAKANKLLKWPHDAPAIPQLAKAGFFYKPTSANPDNTTCYLCRCNLDGWEEEDEPVAEHLKHSPSCGWANIVYIEQAIENGERDLEDPASQRLMEARTMTFGSMWPHENKRGWICKVQKMVEAGWHYCPTLESDDFVRCAFCNLSLDGWEPKDNPHDEHQRRSPDCLFFSFSSASNNDKSQKPKKSRASKLSRMSTQSTVSNASDNPLLEENDLQDETRGAITEAIKPMRGGKKVSKAKRAKAQTLMPTHDDSLIGSSYVEPEDDDFEVKVVHPVISKGKGRKRNSEEMTQAVETSDKTVSKKRRTINRNSTAVGSDIHENQKEGGQATVDSDSQMTNIESKSLSTKPKPKKAKKGAKARGSSAGRKVSSKSTASEASLRAGLPDNEDIDAALLEDLDRPLTDNDADDGPIVLEPPKGRRLTRSRPAPTITDASTAPTRRNTRNSAVTVENNYFETSNLSSQAHQNETRRGEDVREPLLSPLLNPKTTKKSGTRKASAKQKAKTKDCNDKEEVPNSAAQDVDVVKPRQTRGRKASARVPNQEHLMPRNSSREPESKSRSKNDHAMLDARALEDGSEHETEANLKSRPKRGKKPSTVVKVDQRGHVIESAVQAAQEVEQSIAEPQDRTPSSSTNESVEPQAVAVDLQKPTKKPNKLAKPGPKSKSNRIVSKARKFEEEEGQIIDKSEAERQVDVPPSPVAASIHLTPPHVSSPQSSDAENQPPSSRPSQSRPPLSFVSPITSQETRVPLAVIATPCASPKNNSSKLRSTFAWTVIDMETALHGTSDGEKENGLLPNVVDKLTSPEKNLTVEEWIRYNAKKGEAKLRNDCERLVGKFEDQGVRALKSLEGIICTD